MVTTIACSRSDHLFLPGDHSAGSCRLFRLDTRNQNGYCKRGASSWTHLFCLQHTPCRVFEAPVNQTDFVVGKPYADYPELPAVLVRWQISRITAVGCGVRMDSGSEQPRGHDLHRELCAIADLAMEVGPLSGKHTIQPSVKKSQKSIYTLF